MLKGKNLMLKITNRDAGNKRIRLTALDSAMSNIDDSTGAVAKVGRDVLLCLSKAAPIQGPVPHRLPIVPEVADGYGLFLADYNVNISE